MLPHKRDGTSVIPLNFTFTFPGPHAAPLDLAKHPKLPLVFLLNGASVESFWYRRVIGDLASKGFVVASTDYYRPIPSGSPFKPSKLCMDADAIAAPAGLVLLIKVSDISCFCLRFSWGRVRAESGSSPQCMRFAL